VTSRWIINQTVMRSTNTSPRIANVNKTFDREGPTDDRPRCRTLGFFELENARVSL
jgi:hypothetical protein